MQKPEASMGSSITLLSGFLGAGKTTLLKRILASEEDLSGTAVIVNEFGDVGIDGSLLSGAASDMVELTNGCICCTLSADLNRTLTELRDTAGPRRILIEASGVADPEAVIKALDDPDLAQSMSLDRVVTVVDVRYWQSRHVFGAVFLHQLRGADLILLNKVDLLPENEAASCLDSVQQAFPDITVVPVVRCRLDLSMLWDASGPGHRPPQVEASRHDHLERQGFVSFSFHSERPLDEARFSAFVEAMPLQLFRMKGPVHFPDRVVMVSHVGGETEYTDWDRADDTTLALIGWDVSPNEVLAALRGCTAASGSWSSHLKG